MMIRRKGLKAFIRLQETIVQTTNDLSLFAWTNEPGADRQRYHGIFPVQSPSQFIRCGNLVSIRGPLIQNSQSFSLTNRGVEFDTPLKLDTANGDYIMLLYHVDHSEINPDAGHETIRDSARQDASWFSPPLQ